MNATTKATKAKPAKRTRRTPKTATPKPSEATTAAPEPSPPLNMESSYAGRMGDDLDFRVELARSLVHVISSALQDADVPAEYVDHALFVLGEEMHALHLRTRALIQGPEPYAADARALRVAAHAKEVA